MARSKHYATFEQFLDTILTLVEDSTFTGPNEFDHNRITFSLNKIVDQTIASSELYHKKKVEKSPLRRSLRPATVLNVKDENR